MNEAWNREYLALITYSVVLDKFCVILSKIVESYGPFLVFHSTIFKLVSDYFFGSYITQQLNRNQRMLVLKEFRSAGKTSLMLQDMKVYIRYRLAGGQP